MRGNNQKAMLILSKLKQKPQSTFTLKPVNVETVYESIMKAKKSKSTGWDSLNMFIIKEVPQFIARVCCHLYNSILRTKIYPDCLKTAKIIPIKKAEKCPIDKDSYRPISRLPTIDKIIEDLIRNQMEKYFEDNAIIPDQHHGGRKSHSTMTALMAIDKDIKTTKAKKKTSSLLTTDLTSAFDLVDHELLIEKMKFYGIQKDTTDIISSFLSNRKVFTELQGFRSSTKNQEACSVIQGSKLSGFFYTIFSIEIPLLPTLMKNSQLIETILEMKIPNYYGVTHNINQYVDDSSNTIGTDSEDEMKKYVESYIAVLDKYYEHNKLKLNSGKTNIIMTKKTGRQNNTDQMTFTTATGEKVKESNSIKILGITLNNRGSMDTYLNIASGRIVRILTELSPLMKFMSLKTRQEIVYSKAASILLYGSQLFTGLNQWAQRRFTAIIMRCNRSI